MGNVPNPHNFLTSLALVLCVAAVTTVLFARLRQPVVLGYIVAGLVVGPHFSFPQIVDEETIKTLSELGVILVMFSLGLEFSLRRLLQTGMGAALIAMLEVSVMLWLGFSVARLFGWSTTDAIFAAAAVSISSTTIIAKTFEEQKIKGRLRDIVFGVLIFEDLIAILLLTALPNLVSGRGTVLQTIGTTAGRLLVFLVVLVVAGMLVVPRIMRFVVRLRRSETLLVASVGLCFAVALLVQHFGYSVALGAFLAGSLVAESGAAFRVEALIKPVRDVFAAIFFVSVGMLVEPRFVLANWGAVLLLSALVIVGKLVAVTGASFFAGNGVRDSVRAGMSLGQVGEFSYMLVATGLSLGRVQPFLFPVIVAVSVVTTLTTPLLVRGSGRAATRAHERLPPVLQTFVSLYGSWVERLQATRTQPRTAFTRVRRLTILLAVDAAVLISVVVAVSAFRRGLAQWFSRALGLDPSLGRQAVIALGLLLCAPFALGIFRIARGLGLALAELALPRVADGKQDLAAAPRRALIVTLQLGVLVGAGVPIVAATQPFLPPFQGGLLLFVVSMALVYTFWKSANNLQGHVRAGAEVIVEVLAAQSSTEPHTDEATTEVADTQALSALETTLPGIGRLVRVHVGEGSVAVGKTLVELNLRGLTGATVLAISRAKGAVVNPTGRERLEASDVLAISGTAEAVSAARALIVAKT
ncbi:MAG: cation:proton antiporter [Deltaproteobacteria bacterium]|nr:cation:proton antiporter [Deltaproteobacteria bacterium]